jgi:hypothetical protein
MCVDYVLASSRIAQVDPNDGSLSEKGEISDKFVILDMLEILYFLLVFCSYEFDFEILYIDGVLSKNMCEIFHFFNLLVHLYSDCTKVCCTWYVPFLFALLGEKDTRYTLRSKVDQCVQPIDLSCIQERVLKTFHPDIYETLHCIVRLLL